MRHKWGGGKYEVTIIQSCTHMLKETKKQLQYLLSSIGGSDKDLAEGAGGGGGKGGFY